MYVFTSALIFTKLILRLQESGLSLGQALDFFLLLILLKNISGGGHIWQSRVHSWICAQVSFIAILGGHTQCLGLNLG